MTKPKKANISVHKKFNPLTSIWIVPLIALMISMWIAYKHYSQIGSEIRIFLESSSGLQAGQSVIKYRNVPVGKITKIEIDKEGKGVIVVAKMAKHMSQFINETTHFWVVSPRLDYSGVSGLDTIISGSYIAMHAKKDGEAKEEFIGSDTPYRDIDSGDYFVLHTNSITNIGNGAPVSYHNIQVGEVEQVVLSSDNLGVDMIVFIKKEYSYLINETSKFWLRKLASIKLNGSSLDVDVAPIFSHLAFGGITFESKLDKEYPKAATNYFYELYDSQEQAQSKKIGSAQSDNREFVFLFKGNLAGLHLGADIQYQGFSVGEVKDISLHYDSDDKIMNGIVTAVMDVSIFEDQNKSGFEILQKSVDAGMRASLHSSNPILGGLNIRLDFEKENNRTLLAGTLIDGKKIIFPVINSQKPTAIDGLLATIENTSRNLDKSLAETTKTINQSLKSVTKNLNKSLVSSTRNLNKSLLSTTKNLNKSLSRTTRNLDKTMKSTRKLMDGYNSNSLFGRKITDMLKEIHESTEETKYLLHKVNKKPNSLIFGD